MGVQYRRYIEGEFVVGELQELARGPEHGALIWRHENGRPRQLIASATQGGAWWPLGFASAAERAVLASGA